ncbi:MAG: hypothetical protein PUB97_05335 [Ruminococcus sp.]|nr:hypothetical protein [Ruminococcus sp.]
MKKAFEIPNIRESLKSDVEHGKISLEEAAKELYKANFTPYIDEQLTIDILGLSNKKN